MTTLFQGQDGNIYEWSKIATTPLLCNFVYNYHPPTEKPDKFMWLDYPWSTYTINEILIIGWRKISDYCEPQNNYCQKLFFRVNTRQERCYQDTIGAKNTISISYWEEMLNGKDVYQWSQNGYINEKLMWLCVVCVVTFIPLLTSENGKCRFLNYFKEFN